MAAEKKKRISVLAKQYEVPGELLVKLLNEKGFDVLSPASNIGHEEFLAVKEQLLKEKEKLDSQKSRTSHVRRTDTSAASNADSAKGIRKKKATVTTKVPKGVKVTLKRASHDDEADTNNSVAKAPESSSSPAVQDTKVQSTPEAVAPIEKPVGSPAEKSVEKSVEKPIEKVTETPTPQEAKASQPSPEASSPVVDENKVIEKPVESATEKPAAQEKTPTEPSKEQAPVAQNSAPKNLDESKSAKTADSKEGAPIQKAVSESTEEKTKPQAQDTAKGIPDSTASAEAPAKAEKSGLSDAVIDANPEKRAAPMKAKVEIDPALAARIQKYTAAKKKSASKSGPGYTGHFGASRSQDSSRPSGGDRGAPRAGGPGGPGGHRGPGGPGSSGGPGRGPQSSGPGGSRPAGGGFGAPRGNTGGGYTAPGSNPVLGGAPPAKDGAARTDRTKKGKGKKQVPTRKEKMERRQEQMEAVRHNVKSVMANLSKGTVKKTYKRKEDEVDESTDRPMLKVSDFMSIAEFAGMMEQMPNKVIAKCMELGMMVTINARLDFETITLLADEFGFDTELMEEYGDELTGTAEEEDEASLIPRAPVVTVMGHVDHGKTSVLDWIRSENVVAGESGGITQHIGAYEVNTPYGNVTFLDTPGHEAFSAMRARGSQVTDVVVLVVAADDRVMPQTIESIEHAKAAKVPMVVAINKMDLSTANPDRIRAELAERGVEVEQWGGNTSCVEVSAHTGAGMDRLLEILALESEVLDLKANPNTKARGTVVESQLDRGKGSIATVLIQNGTLKVGDSFVCGVQSGKVRAMLDERGRPKLESPPSSACQVLGFDGTPQAGDDLIVVADDKMAREIASTRRMAARERDLRAKKHISLENIYDKVKSGEFSELNIIVKADVDGSAEAIAASLEKLSNKEVKINIIRKGVGAVNDSDITLAAASEAIVIAFHILPSRAARDMAEQEGVEIRSYRIIYEIIEEIGGVLEGMLKPTIKEELVGEAEVKELFKIPKVGMIAGCMVSSGQVERDAQLRVYRHGTELGIAQVQSLKHHKDDVKKVSSGMECGIGVKGIENLQVGDTFAFFKEVEVARTLADVAKEQVIADEKQRKEDAAKAKDAASKETES
jgi:translation initiation factor IF-2